MAIGDIYPVKGCSVPATIKITGKWTGGGAATNCTKATADWSRGISSVNYNGATGKYRITFTDIPGQQLVDWNLPIARATGVTNALVAKVVEGSYSISAKTLDFEVVSVLTPAATDLTTTDKVYINLTFSSSPPP